MPANWQTVTIPAGQTEATIPLSLDTVSVPPGRARKADGGRWSGHDRPRWHLEEAGTETKVVLSKAAAEDVVLSYKADVEDVD